jgi:hypothetical protein
MAPSKENPHLHLIENWRPLIQAKIPLANPQRYRLGIDILTVANGQNINETEIIKPVTVDFQEGQWKISFDPEFVPYEFPNPVKRIHTTFNTSGTLEKRSSVSIDVWKYDMANGQDRYDLKLGSHPRIGRSFRNNSFEELFLDFPEIKTDLLGLDQRWFKAFEYITNQAKQNS